ncbi:hypothetical protein GCM10028801_31320 [Nocardioides maradonensis]
MDPWNRYTVIGYYVDDEPYVAGVIEGDHEVGGGNESFGQPWATCVDAPNVAAAEDEALSEIRALNGWGEE